MDKKDPHSPSERHSDPIGHSYSHKFNPTDSVGKDLQAKENAAGSQPLQNVDGSEDAQNLESQGGWRSKVTPQNTSQSSKNLGRREAFLKGFKKKGLPVTGILGVVIGLLIGGSFFGATLAPFMFLHNVHIDLSDITSINQKRTSEQIADKFDKTKTGTDKVSLGCTTLGSKLSRKCKLKSVSPWLEDKLKAVDIEIEGTRKVGGRVIPERYIDKRTGRSYNAEQFAAAMRGGDPDFWGRYHMAINSNWLAYKGKTFINGVLKRFGVSERPVDLGEGDHDEKAKRFMSGAAASGNVGEPTFSRKTVTDEATGEEREVWVDDLTGEEVDDATREARIAAADPVNANTKPRTQMAVSAAEKVGFGLNVLGWADAACTIRNLIGQASLTAKISNAEQLGRYAGAILPSVSKLQAGHVLDPEEAQIIQETFVETDARKMIAGFVEDESGGDNAIKADEVPNPDYGKNAMDSELYKMSAGGGVAHVSEAERNYSLGVGVESLFAALASGTFNVLNFATTVKNYDSCEFVQSKFGRILGMAGGAFITIVGIVTSAAGVGVAVLAGQAAKAALTIIAFTAASMLLTRWINSIYTTSLISDTMDQVPVERGAALWTGMAVLTSANSQMRGMMPASADEIVAYQQEQNIANQKYIAMQRQMSDPLDIRNPYSLTGTVAFAIASHIPNTMSAEALASLPTNIASFVASGISSSLNPATANAASFNPERFKQCDDQGYQDIGIDADVQCNVRYVMPAESVRWSPLEAAQLMEDRGFVEPDTTTGYPQSYTPPAPEKLQQGAMDMIKGAAKDYMEGIIKLVYNTESYENKYNEEKTPDSPNGAKYAKFLDYCVYRAMPFGKTFEDDAADKAVGKEWLDGSKCRDTADEDINLFRIYVFDMSVDDDLDGPIQEPYCAPSSLAPGSAMGKATAADIDAAIEASEQNNPNNPHPLHGKGAAIIEISNKHGVNSDLIAVTLLAETQFGADGTVGPANNNFGYNKLNEFNECDPFYVNGEPYNCYLTPEAGLEGILKNLTGNPDYRSEVGPTAPPGTQPNTIASVRTIYCPEGDGDCNLNNFLAMGEAINIPIKADDPVFGSASSPGTSSSPSPVRSDSVKLSKNDLERKIATYGLPPAQASGEKGYEALAKMLKDDPNALWSAQSFLTGEKNATAKGIDVKQYLTTAWVWFETGVYPDLYEVNCRSNTEHPTNEVCRIDYSDNDKVQVAGYQAWDVMDKFREVYGKLYTESELQTIMEKVIDNSSKASIEPWKYQESDKEKVKGVTLNDIYPSEGRDYGAGDDAVFNDEKRQFLSFILGKDPNMAAALNSFAVSEDDVIKHISGPGCGPGWAVYICDSEKQLISNMMMALYLIDDGTMPTSDVQCAGTSSSRGSGVGIAAVWGGEGEKDLSYGFDYGPAAGPWYEYSKAYGMSGYTHTGTDIPMDPYAPVYSPVEGIVVCERNNSGDGLPGIGCGGSADYSLTGEYGCVGEPGKPGGAGTVLIQITENGQPTGDALRLGHLAESLVKNGDKVTPNQQIGLAGCMNGWHTHVEYFIPAPGVTSSGWKLVDPVEYLGGNGGNA